MSSPPSSPTPRHRPSRRAAWRRWAGPIAALLVALVAATVLWSKMRRETWAYYSDGAGIEAEVGDPAARPVLWEDPEPQSFDGEPPPTGSAGRLEASFSPDGTTMLLVRDQEDGSDLYHSRWDGRTWSPPEPLTAVNSAANERGPALTRDGRTLYFSSDRKGGEGGYDLYRSRWDGRQWQPPTALPASINTPANEGGPALSSDDDRLFFSSDRDGQEDIYFSRIEGGPSPDTPGRYSAVQPADTLNSSEDDLQAAMTSRGDHVFLASDRERDGRHGFRVYFSRVVDGEMLPPERVDLYLENGDATDPAVRMEGFDLLFSANQGPAVESPDRARSYELYRSTTREVITYTDWSRWEQFKELLHTIKWWILLALAALIALIYILEKWRDITSLFHKCLAGSALIHLIALLVAMVLLIAREIQHEEESYVEVEIDIDALAQEELALESLPEETELTDTPTNLEQEKAEAEFGAPGFEAQEEQQEVPKAAPATRQEMVEAQPALSEAIEQPAPAQEASVLSELAPSELPPIEAPTMEEREAREEPAVADSSKEFFEPETPMQESEQQSERSSVADTAVETEADAREVTDAPPVEAADEPAVAVVEVPLIDEPEDNPSEQEPLVSEVLRDLPATEFVDPGEVTLDEAMTGADGEPRDPTEETFTPEGTVAGLTTEPAANVAPADSAAQGGATTDAVAPGETAAEASSPGEAVTARAAESAAGAVLPEPGPAAEAPTGLPALALEDLSGPTMEERSEDPDGTPADPSIDTFQPTGADTSLATNPARSSMTADRAIDAEPPTGEIASSDPQDAPDSTALPVTPEATPTSAGLPPADLVPVTINLPETPLIDPGANARMEERNDPADGTPADSSEDLFNPSSTVAGLNTTPAEARAVSDAATRTQSTSTDIASETSNPAAGAVTAADAMKSTEATREADTGPLLPAALPATALIDPAGAVAMEEPATAGGPADSGEDQFQPGGASALVTSPVTSTPGGDGAVANPLSASVVNGQSARGTSPSAVSGGATTPARNDLPSTGGAIAPGLAPLAPVGGSLLPGTLEAPRGMTPEGLAKVIQKQRGKPGLDTIRQMGGSDGTEQAIGAAISWLVENQESDGRWDTRKHGARHEYDTGGTGLALLCFYGWGERHDRGKHRDSVRRALDWLLAQQDDRGYLGGRPAMMYSHAIASIALCEAYGITREARLREPAERAIAYTLAAQSKTLGGWRYNPGNDSDTSITGWQYMALHSARMAGLEVPEEAFERARRYLDRSGGGKHGGIYGYQSRSKPSNAMVATGMFCRQLDLVPPGDPRQQESARWLKLRPMRSSKPDYYYVYYGTLALYQHQGPTWNAWNEKMKEVLPLIQHKSGSRKGSWDPGANITEQGGRVVSTSLATLSLEVYYRLLPMYGFRNQEAEAPEVKTRGEDRQEP